MGIKSYKPTSAGIRWLKSPDFKELTKGAKPEKSLLVSLKKTGGRNSHGRITSRHRGGGHKRKLRLVDFIRGKHDIKARVLSIQYDPNRTGRVALVQYADGEKSYIISPLGLRVNDEIVAAPNAEIKIGNAMQLKSIPAGNVSVTLTVVVTSPAGETALTISPSLYPRCLASFSLISIQVCGENFFSRDALELLIPLPKWCSIDPDNRVSGYPSLGALVGGVYSTWEKRPKPLGNDPL